MGQEKLSLVERDGIRIGRIVGEDLRYTARVFEHFNRERSKNEPEEMFKSPHGDLHPDIFPDFDQRIFRKKKPRGMIMDPDDFLNSQFESNPRGDITDPASDFARYDPI